MSGTTIEAPAPAPAPVTTPDPATPVVATTTTTQPATPGSEGKPAEAPKGAPEKYADFKMPEGVATDPKMMEGFQGIAKAQNLTQDQAQALVDFHATNVKSMVDAHQQEVNSWPAKIAADKELGGPDSPAKIAAAQRAIERFGTPELKAFLDLYQLGTHPEMVRAFWKIGAAIKEDSVAGTNGVPGGVIPGEKPADRFYRTAEKATKPPAA